MRPLITLLTDFGLASHYPAQTKGVILSECPAANIIDITHGVRPQHVREGAVMLRDAAPCFPDHTLHVAVVDPGVGTAREMIYAEIGSQQFLAPDNGLLTAVLAGGELRRAFYLRNRELWRADVAATFHGRDVLAPVAGRLANGMPPEALGPTCAKLVLLSWPVVHRGPRELLGEVLLVDSFGNLITNIAASQLDELGPLPALTIECGGMEVSGVQRTYGYAQPGETIALIDSQGRLEIAVVNGSAARLWSLEEGTSVRVSLP